MSLPQRACSLGACSFGGKVTQAPPGYSKATIKPLITEENRRKLLMNFIFRAHSSMVERGTHNPLVAGSNPAGPNLLIRHHASACVLKPLQNRGFRVASPYSVSHRHMLNRYHGISSRISLLCNWGATERQSLINGVIGPGRSQALYGGKSAERRLRRRGWAARRSCRSWCKRMGRSLSACRRRG